MSEDYKELEVSYGDNMLVLVVACGFIERLLAKPEIEGFSGGAATRVSGEFPRHCAGHLARSIDDALTVQDWGPGPRSAGTVGEAAARGGSRAAAGWR